LRCISYYKQQQQPQLQQQRGSLTGGMAGLNLFSSQQSQQQPLQLGASGTNGSSANTADFGDFQSTTSNTSGSNNAANNNTTAGQQQQQSQQLQSAVPKKWGDLASLVELGSLRTNTEKKAAEDASAGVSERQNSAAFAGLDGFGGPAAGGLSGSAHQQPLGGMMGSYGQQQQQPQQFGGQGMSCTRVHRLDLFGKLVYEMCIYSSTCRALDAQLLLLVEHVLQVVVEHVLQLVK
jgi:hypothetical protein